MAPRRWIILAVVLASGIVFLDSTIVNVALPEIGRDMESRFLTDLEAQAYIYYGYLLTLSALLVLAGALSDYHGRKRVFTMGLWGFGVTSVLCGLAPNLELLIVSRILQGAAGAVLVPGSLAIITASFADEEQGRAFGIWAGASAGTTIFGPAIGGFLVYAVSWRAAFLINIPLVAIAIWASRHISESRDETASGKFHWSGALIVALAIGGLTFGGIRGQAQNWADPIAFVALAVGVACVVIFPFAMKRSANPLVPLDMFASRNFSVTNVSTLLIYGALYVIGQFLALLSIGTLGYNEVAFGVAGIPTTLFLVLFSSRFGALAVRYGPRIFMTIGPAVMGLGLLWLTRLPATSTPWRLEVADVSTYMPPADYFIDLLPGFVVFGIGLTVMVAPLTTALMRSVPVDHSGVASAINNAISRVGPQFVGAILFIAVTTSFYGALEQRLSAQEVDSPRFRRQVSPLNPPDPGVPQELHDDIDEASTEAFHLAMWVSAALCFAGAAVNAVGIRNDQLHAEEAPAASPVGD